MIIELLFDLFFFVIKLLFSIIPDTPPFPAPVLEAITSFFPSIAEAVGFVQYLYGYDFYKLVFAFGMGMFGLYVLYSLGLWVIKKIPGGMD